MYTLTFLYIDGSNTFWIEMKNLREKTSTCLSYLLCTMAADGLEMSGARVSTVMEWGF